MTDERAESVISEPDPTSSADSSTGDASPREAISVRRFLSDTMIFGLVSVFDRAIGFILLPITTWLMEPEEYGTLSLFQTTTELLQYVVALGIYNAFFRFYAEVTLERDKREIFNAAIWQVSMLALLASAVIFPFASEWGKQLFDSPSLLMPLLIVPTTYLGVLISLGDCRLQADGRAWLFFRINVLYAVVMRGLALLLLALGWGAAGWIVGQVAGQVIAVVLFFIVAFHGVHGRVDLHWMKTLFKFGVILVPLAISHWAMQGTAKYIMNATLDDPKYQLGLYTVGERISQIMNMMNLAFALGWRRFAFSNMHHEDGPRLLGHGATIFTVISGISAVGLILLGDDLTRWLIDEKYWPGTRVIPFLTLAAFFWGLCEVLAISLYKGNKAHVLSGVYIVAAVLCISLNLVLIPKFGLVGAASGWMASEFFKVLAVGILGQRRFRLHIQYGRVLHAALVFIPTLILGMVLFPSTTLMTTAAQAGMLAVACLLLVGTGFLVESERALIAQQWRTIRAKIGLV